MDADAALTAVLTAARTTDAAGGSAPVRLRVEMPTSIGAKEAVRATVRRHLGRGWTVEPLFPNLTRPAERERLGRFFLVTGPPGLAASGLTTMPETAGFAWDLGYTLGDAFGEDALVRPDLPHSFAALCPPPPILPESDPHDWALTAMRCQEAWALPPPDGGASKGSGILVGHRDTGYTSHPELESAALNLDLDVDLVDGDFDATDPLDVGPLLNPGHGTHTASVIVGREAGAVMGVAPLATLVPIRAIRSVVNVFDSNVARAVDYARRAGCHVVSMSLGGLFFQGLDEAISVAVQEGLIVMAAAGNCVGAVVWPALYESCVAVAATNAKDRPWVDSSHGPKVAVSAPGEGVWAAGYDFAAQPPSPVVNRHTGTSLAVANLAGVAALWLGHHGRDALIQKYGASRLQAAFLHHVRTAGSRQPAGWDAQEYGAGIVDAEALLKAPLADPADVDAGFRSALATRPSVPQGRPDTVSLIQTLCPMLTQQDVAERLARLFAGQPDKQRSGVSARQERFGAELLYLLSEDRAAREAFTRGDAAPASPAALTPSRAPAWTDRVLGVQASRALRDAMAG